MIRDEEKELYSEPDLDSRGLLDLRNDVALYLV